MSMDTAPEPLDTSSQMKNHFHAAGHRLARSGDPIDAGLKGGYTATVLMPTSVIPDWSSSYRYLHVIGLLNGQTFPNYVDNGFEPVSRLRKP
jgi:hypothetical protein